MGFNEWRKNSSTAVQLRVIFNIFNRSQLWSGWAVENFLSGHKWRIFGALDSEHNYCKDHFLCTYLSTIPPPLHFFYLLTLCTQTDKAVERLLFIHVYPAETAGGGGAIIPKPSLEAKNQTCSRMAILYLCLTGSENVCFEDMILISWSRCSSTATSQ